MEKVGIRLSKAGPLKGTGSPDGLGFTLHIWIDLDLKKGRGWFLNFIGAPPIVH